jgi:hypothetical protein
MIKALEIVGNLLDEASSENTKLPNEFTRGQLNGVTRVYQTLVQEMDRPQQQVQPNTENEDIPFSTPPVSDRGRMLKYGNEDTSTQKNTNSANTSYSSDPLLNEVKGIKDILQRLEQKLFPTSLPDQWSEDAQKIFAEDPDPEDKNVRSAQNIDYFDQNFTPEQESDTRNEMQNLSPQETPEQAERRVINRPWNTSFGKGLGGSDFKQEPQEEIHYDPDTGEQGTVRKIGQKFNPDDEKTVEEWANTGQQVSHPGVYYDKGDFNELEDLQPGE